ncbi:MAG: acetoacetate--CoA ligase [Candidatus Marinimicrobia bacterium]|nr:acetoacetate--CoA ligase [Candidatus Neomarinimicrobiota bacterium]
MNSILWQPSASEMENSRMTEFIHFVNDRFNLKLDNYSNLYSWSIDKSESFWEAYLEFSDVLLHTPYTRVVDDLNKLPGAKWFEGATLNFAENLLKFRDEKKALTFYSETGNRTAFTYNELYKQVSRLAVSMKNMGIVKGDRVAGFLPNIPETVIAMLATSSIGAIWSSCSPDFGVKGVLDRFKQISPKLLFAANGYQYNGKLIHCLDKVSAIQTELRELQKTVIIPHIEDFCIDHLQNCEIWDDFISQEVEEIQFAPLPFDHPLYIMYSSGTTGKPKSIVHSAGGTLLQHLKELQLHTDLHREDTIFYFTTCGWMMWNWLVSSLAVGAEVVLFDGSPFYPNGKRLLQMADELGISIFGTSAKYISSLESAGITPGEVSSYPRLRTILSTGSPLVEKNFDFVYTRWKKEVQLSSISGGTDIISCFALGNPILPVKRGQIQCRGLGMKVEAFNESGASLLNKKGELVCTQAFPSMPVYFWNDASGEKYASAYFSTYPGIWHHGDFIEILDDGNVKIYGRSDTTLNPGGVRIGTSEIYQTVEQISEVEDSLVIGQPWENDERIILFVKLRYGNFLSKNLVDEIKLSIRKNCSHRHVPAKVLQVEDIPYTINGKKVELAVKQIIQNVEIRNKDSLANPHSLNFFKEITELAI